MKKHFILLILLTLFTSGCRSSIVEAPPPHSVSVYFPVQEFSHVKLTVENSYHTVIKTPIDENKMPGYYMESIKSSDMPAGIYYATVECKGINSNYYNVITTRILII